MRHAELVLSAAMAVDARAERVRSNDPEMTSKLVRSWLESAGGLNPFLEPYSRWENGYNESCNGKPRDELLNDEISYRLKEMRIMVSSNGVTTGPETTAGRPRKRIKTGCGWISLCALGVK